MVFRGSLGATWKILYMVSCPVSKVYKLSHTCKPAVVMKNTFALYRYYGRNSSTLEFKRTVSTVQGKVVPPIST